MIFDPIVDALLIAIALCLAWIFSLLRVIDRTENGKKELEQSKTEFVSLASHQLGTPATAIKWYTELLLDPKNLYSEAKNHYGAAIYEANQRMIELIDSLLNVSRIEVGRLAIKPGFVDIVDLSKKVAEEMRPLAVAKQVSISWHVTNPIPIMTIDPQLLRIVVQNLLSNAIKYTLREGKITVSIYSKNSKVYLSVADSGIGIPTKDQHRIFDKMYRAGNALKQTADGSGLGLYLVKSVVGLLGGSITFESAETVGTTFYVILPLKNNEHMEGNLLKQ